MNGRSGNDGDNEPGDNEAMVRIEYTTGETSAPEAPRVVEAAPRRSAALLLVALAALIGGLFWLDRDRDQGTAAPVPVVDESAPVRGTADVDESTQPRTWQEFVNADVELQPIGDLLVSPVEAEPGWFALRRGQRGSRIVESTDGLLWRPIETGLSAGNLFGLALDDDGGLRTLVNSASLNEQRYTLTPAESRDRVEWNSVVTHQHQGSGNLPSQVSLRGDTTVVVGDRSLDIDVPPAGLVGLVGDYAAPDIAEQACQLVFERDGSGQRFDIVDCDGELLGSIADDDGERMNTLSTVAFLLQFQQVVTVQIGDTPIDEIVLDPGSQIVSIEATSTGFLAVVIDALSGIEDGELGAPPGKVVRWSRAGGLVDVTSGLSPAVDLTAWWDNDLAVTAGNEAFFAASGAVYRSQPPYERWTTAMSAPIAGGGGLSILKVGPNGSGLVLQDSFSHVWVGRVGGDWVRAPQLDGGVPRDVLVSSDEHVVVLMEFDSFVFQLARVPLGVDGYVASPPAPEPVSAHLLTSITEFDGDWIGSAQGLEQLVESTDGGLTWMTRIDATDPGGVHSVGRTGSGQPVVLTDRVVGESRVLKTHVWSDGSWGSDPTRLPLELSVEQIVSAEIGEAAIIVTEDLWDEPVTPVVDVLAEFVDRDIAEQTCQIARVITDGRVHYNLLGCTGAIIGEIGASTSGVSRSEDDRLTFAQEIVRSRQTVHMSSSEFGIERVVLGPSQFVLSLVPTDEGFAALILDSLGVLENPDLLYSQALTADLIAWDRETGDTRRLELPIGTSAWSGNRLVHNSDGSLTLVTSLGLHRAAEPFVDWELVTAGPFERLAPGQVFGSALSGVGYFLDDPGGPGLFWATCCGDTAAASDSWTDHLSEGRAFSRVLIADERVLVIQAPDGETLRVAR